MQLHPGIAVGFKGSIRILGLHDGAAIGSFHGVGGHPVCVHFFFQLHPANGLNFIHGNGGGFLGLGNAGQNVLRRPVLPFLLNLGIPLGWILDVGKALPLFGGEPGHFENFFALGVGIPALDLPVSKEAPANQHHGEESKEGFNPGICKLPDDLLEVPSRHVLIECGPDLGHDFPGGVLHEFLCVLLKQVGCYACAKANGKRCPPHPHALK